MTGAVATLVFLADVEAVRTSTAVPGLREWVGGRFLAERYRTASATRMVLAGGGSRSSRGKGLAKVATRHLVVGGLDQSTAAGRPGMPRRILSLVILGLVVAVARRPRT
ncbi:hypothetical protein [Amycolatopsis sp. La24]|uniref:hypothetical protein n=1 Tax=Amycolatopsis sp. La24 TaxID=3028304 RepID=UPI0023B2021B|nr:hypothetical protein [Amycolatopsis sp. La24]